MAKAMVDTAYHLYLWGHDTSASSAYIDTRLGDVEPTQWG